MAHGRGAGILMVLTAGLLYSTAGVFTHELRLDAWTMLGWRAVFGTAFMLLWMGIEGGRGWSSAFRLSPRILALTVPTALCSACYIFALKVTTVADVTVVYATLPFVTALVGWLWIGEVPDRRLWIASAIALCGVLVMALGGTGDPLRLAGMALTMGMNLGLAVILVNARRDAWSSNAVYTLGTGLSGALGFALAPHAAAVGAREFGLLALFGVTTVGLAMALYMAGARRIPAAEVGLIGMLDVASGPVMVWWAFGQQPGRSALAGGAVVMAALLWHLLPDVRALLRPA